MRIKQAFDIVIKINETFNLVKNYTFDLVKFDLVITFSTLTPAGIFTKNARFIKEIRTWSRLLSLDIDVETKLRYLNHRDKLFESVNIFSTVKTYSLPVSRLRLSIETTLRQIATPRLRFLSRMQGSYKRFLLIGP